jgi:histone H3/H4
MDLPLACAERILKKSNMRVSDEAVKEFAALLEEITADIASEAAAVAKSENRKTVLAKDIQEARRKIS